MNASKWKWHGFDHRSDASKMLVWSTPCLLKYVKNERLPPIYYQYIIYYRTSPIKLWVGSLKCHNTQFSKNWWFGASTTRSFSKLFYFYQNIFLFFNKDDIALLLLSNSVFWLISWYFVARKILQLYASQWKFINILLPSLYSMKKRVPQDQVYLISCNVFSDHFWCIVRKN